MLERIKSLCGNNGISVTVLENILGLGRGTILNWTTSSPSIANLKKVADYFGVSVDFLIGADASTSVDAMCIAKRYDNLSQEKRALVGQYFDTIEALASEKTG